MIKMEFKTNTIIILLFSIFAVMFIGRALGYLLHQLYEHLFNKGKDRFADF